jgi:phage shock protein A
MKHPWYTPKEVATYFSNQTAVPAPIDPEVSVDLIKMPFIVRAFQIKQDYSDRLDTVQASVRAYLDSCDNLQSMISQQIQNFLDQLKDLGVTAGKSKKSTDSVWKKLDVLAKAKAILKQGGDQFLSNAEDFLVSLGLPTATPGSGADLTNKALQAEADANAYKDQRITQIEGQIERLENQALLSLQAQAKVQANLSAITQAIQNWKYAKLWVNTPWALVHHGDYQVIPEKGLIHFHDIAGSMDFGAVYDTEDANLISDGAVQITWMSDKITGDPEEMSYWTFIRNQTPGGQPVLVRIVEPTAAKPFLINDDSLVLAENELGACMNADQVTEKAARLAAGPLSAPRQQTGYTWTYPGFWPVQTNGGYNSVSWIMREEGQTGDVLAHTIIRAGNPDDTSYGMASVSRKKHQERLLYGDWEGPGKRKSHAAE